MICALNATKKLRLVAFHTHTNAVKIFVARGEYKLNEDLIFMREIT
jgi:hypothetical protein